MGNNRLPQVAIIIPAYNEEARIARVLQAARGSTLATEIIVVSDGSQDDTAEIAASLGVTVVNLPQNLGKGGAMAAGVNSTRAPIIAFLDADLEGLRSHHIDDIIRPAVMNECDMCVGIFRGGRMLSDTAQRISPYLSGQRAMRRELFEAVPFIAEVRMGVEVVLNDAAKRRKARVLRVVLRGVSNCHKEQKLGFMNGVKARQKMFKEIGQAMLMTHRPRRLTRNRWRK
jgi:glycosyltransferase involved in cell wall biosynthesis